MCEECTIGIWNDYEYYRLITFKELKEEVKEYNYRMDLFRNTWNDKTYKNLALRDFLDRRKSTCLTQFNNCPYCR